MARSPKKGLDWFRHYVDMSGDDKIEYLEAKYGLEGYAIWNKLLEKIYNSGYYIAWSEKYLTVFAAKVNKPSDWVSGVIELCFHEGLFNRSMYEKHHILTSAWIQQNFLDAKERATNKEIKKEFNLLSGDNCNNNAHSAGINAAEIPGDGTLMQQECPRVEESRVDNNISAPPAQTKQGYKIPDEEPPDNGVRDETEFRRKVLEYWRKNNNGLLKPFEEVYFKDLWLKYGSHKVLWSMKQFKLGGHKDYKLIGQALDPNDKFQYDYKKQQFANPTFTGGSSLHQRTGANITNTRLNFDADSEESQRNLARLTAELEAAERLQRGSNSA